MEEWTTIRLLNRKGKSIRAISKELNISRNTVRKALRNDNIPIFNSSDSRKSILDEYKEDIERMLYKDKFIGSRILSEIRKEGFQGGDTTFYDYLRKINGSKNLNKISMPYETESGKQCQFDWAHYKVNISGVENKIYIFSVILGYSRKIKYSVSLSMDQSSICDSIESAFIYFGGVPEEILMDNAKQMVQNPNPSDFKWNDKFYSFCGFYRITPKACKVRTPKTKGKVERPFYYLENHFIKGSSFSSFSELEKKLDDFSESVNNRYHSVIKTTPNKRFEEIEKEKLNKLPADRFYCIFWEMRKVNWDLLISYKGNRYSVPYYFAGKYVWITKVKGQYLKIYSNKGTLIAIHQISSGKGDVIKQEGHYSGIAKDIPKSMIILKKEFIEHFPSHKDFLDNLIAKNNLSSLRHLRGIIGLRRHYSDTDIEKALNKCASWSRYSYKIIISILRGSINSPPIEDFSKYHSKTINDKLIDDGDNNLKRNLKYYEDIS